jgi:gliding motility-associated-like protein
MKKFKATITTYVLISLFFLTSVLAQSTQATRKYRVIAVKNGNSAITSMSNETEVTPTMYLYVPNAFTPNGDGLNDLFTVQGEAIRSFRLQIFNRWGDLIFESSDLCQAWDGKFNGQPVPQGTYVYRLSASSITGKHLTREGTVNVLF